MNMTHIVSWENEFRGKTLNSIRPLYKGEDFKPYVKLSFAGGFEYEVHAVRGAYFDGCFINILRKAKPVEFVNVDNANGAIDVEVWSKDFLMFHLGGTFKDDQQDGAPLTLFRLDETDE